MTWAILGTLILHVAELPMGAAPPPVAAPHFPSTMHAFVWRNWPLVPAERMGEVIGASPAQVIEIGRSMGLDAPPKISETQWRRSYITIIRRNWHLLPYDQLLALLDWTEEEMAYTLREDDFLFVKLGNLKPDCPPLRYAPPDAAAQARAAEIAAVVDKLLPQVDEVAAEPLFGFIETLSRMPEQWAPITDSRFSPRFCSSYCTVYGDPLLEDKADAYPEGYLAQLAATGVDGLWMQGVLYTLAPFPWDAEKSARYEERLDRLAALVARCRHYGIGVYLYLNEPRAMPLTFFEDHPDLKGVTEGDYATLCTSAPEVQAYIRDAVALICEHVPDLAGFFTISGSENLTHCWSHGGGAACARCADRGPEAVVAEANGLIREGIAQTDSKARLIAWDWGWADGWVEGIVARLPKDVAVMSVSEWSIPIQRGGIDSVVGEYSISEVGPGPRATRHWALARAQGLDTLAKIQANNTWELSAVPYIPAVENVARHAANLRDTGVKGLMLGWTLGGYPSPNLEVVAEMGRGEARSVDAVLAAVAERRYGPALAPAVVRAWKGFSAAFREFPFHIGVVYSGPQQMGPANPLWEQSTGYAATMVGFPYDHLDGWRAVYPPAVFTAQFRKMAEGMDAVVGGLRNAIADEEAGARAAAEDETNVMEACAIHYRSVANQAEFIQQRNALTTAEGEETTAIRRRLEALLDEEIALAQRLYVLQRQDSRFGFEASNHYFYIPIDLAEKIINCQDLKTRWLKQLP